MKERITTILTRYKGKLKYVDAVNEAVSGLDSTGNFIWGKRIWMKLGWYEGKKYRFPLYFVEAFKTAREVGGKDLMLILNLNGNSTPDGKFAEATFKLYEAMRYEGIPVDGVGLQMHLYLSEDGNVTENKTIPWTQEKFASMLKRYSDAGIKVHITEFDVYITKQPATAALLEKQAEIYRQVLETAIKSPAVKTFKTWGFTDKYSWARNSINGTPLLFDEAFAPKPAYVQQVEMLKTLAKTIK
jgi:endo-1,4-beta-xylanase